MCSSFSEDFDGSPTAQLGHAIHNGSDGTTPQAIIGLDRVGRQQPEISLSPGDVLEESLNDATPEQIALKLKTTQTSEEPVEINTVF